MLNRQRVFITGVGVVSSIGVGRAEFFRALELGKSGISVVQSFDAHGLGREYAGEAKAFRPEGGGGGWLIRLGEPDRVDWWAEGRQATRAEILASMMSGYPLLADEARKEGPEALHDLSRMRDDALRFLPAG